MGIKYQLDEDGLWEIKGAHGKLVKKSKEIIEHYKATKRESVNPLLAPIKRYLETLQAFANDGDVPYKVDFDTAERDLLDMITRIEGGK